MTRYLGTPDYTHGTPARVGILLVNLGTPADPSPGSVREYLAEFLWDPRVIEQPRWLWWLVLHGVILRTRPRRSAHAYQKIWTPDGSPLLLESRALTEGLARRLQQRSGDSVAVDLAMTYGQPSIVSVLERFRRRNVQRLLVLPLYPQYSSTTTGSIFEFVTRELGRWRWMPELRFVNQYWQNERYLAAVANSVAAHWRSHGRKHLLFSFHSIPKRYFLAGDPYHCFCQGTARDVVQRLGLADGEWSIGFQSRFGREEWLKPYVDVLLRQYAQKGPKQVTVVCPGFATDCLETLEEISMQNREMFLARGGEAFDYVPCLNSGEAHVAVLEDVVAQHGQGWPELAPAPADDVARARSRERALALGAER
ncbi:MAG TPA: ferrochelatase [Steroidobacteraceae bacterium]|nr:ferrochelatase [Steroidobacteraceae bacterium]